MLNRKTLFVVTLILTVGLILAGCRTQTPTEPVAAQAPTTQPASGPSPQPVPTQTAEPAPTDPPTEVPTDAPTEAPTATVSFANDVMPILQNRCVNCHGGERVEEGLVMHTYEDIMAGSDNGSVVVPGDVTNSLLVDLVASQKMPKRGPKLTPPQVQTITEWVAAGAPNN